MRYDAIGCARLCRLSSSPTPHIHPPPLRGWNRWAPAADCLRPYHTTSYRIASHRIASHSALSAGPSSAGIGYIFQYGAFLYALFSIAMLSMIVRIPLFAPPPHPPRAPLFRVHWRTGACHALGRPVQVPSPHPPPHPSPSACTGACHAVRVPHKLLASFASELRDE